MRNTPLRFLSLQPEAGSILAVTLWVLVLLSVLGIATARLCATQIQAANFYLRLNSSLSLAEAAVQESFYERKADKTLAYDSEKELVKERKQEWEDGLGYSFHYEDEGSRININTASSAILAGLPGLNEESAELIVKSNRRPFKVKEEIILVEGITPDKFARFKDVITVYGDGKININAAPGEVLSALALDNNLIKLILAYRGENKGPDGQPDTDDDGAFTSPSGILPELRRISLLSLEEEQQLLSAMNLLTVKSEYLRVIINTEINSRVGNSFSPVVYPREKKIVFWKEGAG